MKGGLFIGCVFALLSLCNGSNVSMTPSWNATSSSSSSSSLASSHSHKESSRSSETSSLSTSTSNASSLSTSTSNASSLSTSSSDASSLSTFSDASVDSSSSTSTSDVASLSTSASAEESSRSLSSDGSAASNSFSSSSSSTLMGSSASSVSSSHSSLSSHASGSLASEDSSDESIDKDSSDAEKKKKWVPVAKPAAELITAAKHAFHTWAIAPVDCKKMTVSVEHVDQLIYQKSATKSQKKKKKLQMFSVTTTITCLSSSEATKEYFNSKGNFILHFYTKDHATYHLTECNLVKSGTVENWIEVVHKDRKQNVCLSPRSRMKQTLRNSKEESTVMVRFFSNVNKKTVALGGAAGVSFLLLVMVVALVYTKHQANRATEAENNRSVLTEYDSSESSDDDEGDLEDGNSPTNDELKDEDEKKSDENAVVESTPLNKENEGTFMNSPTVV